MNSPLVPVPAHLLNICSDCRLQYIRRFNHRPHARTRAHVAACSTVKTNSHYLQFGKDFKIIARVTARWAFLLFSDCPLLFSGWAEPGDWLLPLPHPDACSSFKARLIHLLPADQFIPPPAPVRCRPTCGSSPLWLGGPAKKSSFC